MAVAVYYVVKWKVLFPIGGGLVVALQTFGCIALEDSGIQASGV